MGRRFFSKRKIVANTILEALTGTILSYSKLLHQDVTSILTKFGHVHFYYLVLPQLLISFEKFNFIAIQNTNTFILDSTWKYHSAKSAV